MHELYEKYMRYWNMMCGGLFIDKDGNKIYLHSFQELGQDVVDLLKERIKQKYLEYEKEFDESLLEYIKQDFIEKLKKEGKL